MKNNEIYPLIGPESARAPSPAAKRRTELRPNMAQPYIIRKGDTLWDISRHFFKDPKKWPRIWKHNLYISNPDLIYPGNKIWFDVKSQRLIVRSKRGFKADNAGIHPAAGILNVSKLPAGGLDGEQLLSITINGQSQHDTTHVLIDEKGRPSLRISDLHHWRLRVPIDGGVLHDGEHFLPLAALAGVSYSIDERTATLTITATPNAFEMRKLKENSQNPVMPQTTIPGLFVNYDINAQHVEGTHDVNGIFEAGAFGFGSLTSSMLGQKLDGAPRWTRLDTTWRFDQPASMKTLQLGDAISHTGAWGRSVRFGGLQWGTNFSTRPGFIPFALPMTRGETALPSTVDLYINNELAMRKNVPAGPFEIYNLPVVTGAGQLQVVVRDLLGRQQVITQPYYATPDILAAGLHDFSYEFGLIRRDYGLASNCYGPAFAALTHRYGFNDWFTGEGRIELLRRQQTAGLSGFFRWDQIGVFSMSLAYSHSRKGLGGLMDIDFEHIGHRFGLRLSTETTNRDFTQLGLADWQSPPKQIDQAFISWSWNGASSLGTSFIRQRNYDQPPLEFVTGNYNQRLGRRWWMNISASHNMMDRSNSIFLTLTRSIGSRDSLSMAATSQGQTQQVSLDYQHSLPAGSGVGYRLRAYGGDTGGGEASLAVQNDAGTYTVEAAGHSGVFGSTDVRFGARGGVALLDGRVFASRYLDNNSFGVVSVPGYAGVRVYAHNQLVARTDADGYAFVPGLHPYQKNRVSIALSDLPFDAQVDANQLIAVPAWRSGTLITFPVQPSHGVLLHVLIADNKPLPTDADVHIVGHNGRYPVGLGGEVYLTGVEQHTRVRIDWHHQRCVFSIAYPENGGPTPDLGSFHCNEVKAK